MTQFVAINVIGPNYQLIPLNRLTYDGFVTLRGKDYRLRVQMKSLSDLSGAALKGDWKLSLLLSDAEIKSLIAQRLRQCSDLKDFMDELLDILTDRSRDVRFLDDIPFSSARISTQILDEIQTVGWHRVSFIDADFTQIHFCTTDPANRKHTLQIHFPKSFPVDPPTVHADIPFPLQSNCSQNNWLLEVYEKFNAVLSRCQLLWDVLEEVSAEAWVLEPDKPLRKDVHRRIALGNGSSLMVTVDPDNPREIPSYRFLGSDRMTKPLEEKLQSGLSKWSASGSIVKNLENILDIEFPSASSGHSQEFREECAICYMYNFAGATPDKTCDDARCNQQYHTVCLYEWLKELPTSRQSFDTIFGNCPYCDKPITCKMPHFK